MKELKSADYYQKLTYSAEKKAKLLRLLLWVALLGGAALSLIPFYLMFAMSVKSEFQLSDTSPWALPDKLMWENYATVLNNDNAPFYKFLRNTVLIAFTSTLGVLISASMVAYGFARLKFPGRDRLFILVLGTMMLPGIVMLVPSYVLFKYLGWVDTFNPFIIPAFLGGGAYNVFLLRQFFQGIPRDLDEAALIDGASYATIFWRIILPNAGPALATVGIFSFIYNWRDFMNPLILLNSPENQTLELGLNTYRSLNQNRWELLMAGSVLVTIPLIILFLLGQKYFVKGIAMTGIK